MIKNTDRTRRSQGRNHNPVQVQRNPAQAPRSLTKASPIRISPEWRASAIFTATSHRSVATIETGSRRL